MKTQALPQKWQIAIFKYLTAIPPITANEVLNAVNGVDVNKTPGLDGIPNKILKIAAQKRIDIFCELFTTCVQDGVFPEPWKRQRLVLIPKVNKPPQIPSSYRPLCMLDTTG